MIIRLMTSGSSFLINAQVSMALLSKWPKCAHFKRLSGGVNVAENGRCQSPICYPFNRSYFDLLELKYVKRPDVFLVRVRLRLGKKTERLWLELG